MFQKRDRMSSYNVKCTPLNLFHYDFPSFEASEEDTFSQIVHASNPLIRVTVSIIYMACAVII